MNVSFCSIPAPLVSLYPDCFHLVEGGIARAYQIFHRCYREVCVVVSISFDRSFESHHDGRAHCEWLQYSMDLNGSIISGDMARLSTTIRGTVEVDGKHADILTHFNQIAQPIKETFDESKNLISAKSSQEFVTGADKDGGKRAIMYMQLVCSLDLFFLVLRR